MAHHHHSGVASVFFKLNLSVCEIAICVTSFFFVFVFFFVFEFLVFKSHNINWSSYVSVSDVC